MRKDWKTSIGWIGVGLIISIFGLENGIGIAGWWGIR